MLTDNVKQDSSPTPGLRAIFSLILGILSIVPFGFVTGIFAIKLGSSELKAISKGKAPQSGTGTAKIGYVLGYIGTVLYSIGIFILLVLFLIGSSQKTLENSKIAFDRMNKPKPPFSIRSVGFSVNDQIRGKPSLIIKQGDKLRIIVEIEGCKEKDGNLSLLLDLQITDPNGTVVYELKDISVSRTASSLPMIVEKELPLSSDAIFGRYAVIMNVLDKYSDKQLNGTRYFYLAKAKTGNNED